VRLQDFVKRSNGLVTLQSINQCVLGAVKVGTLVGKITAWGDATEIVPLAVTLQYRSLQDLFGDIGQCDVFASKKSARESEIVFVINHTPVGIATITTKTDMEEANFKGTCTWE